MAEEIKEITQPPYKCYFEMTGNDHIKNGTDTMPKIYERNSSRDIPRIDFLTDREIVDYLKMKIE